MDKANTLIYSVSLASGQDLNTMNKITKLYGGVRPERECVLDIDYMLNKGLNNQIGVERNEVINKVVADSVMASQHRILSGKNYNKICVDAVLKTMDPLQNINMEMVEIIQVDTVRVGNNLSDGDQVITILSMIKDTGSEKDIYLNFKQNPSKIKDYYNKDMEIVTYSQVVMDIIQRLRIYKPEYWRIKGVTIRIEDMELLMSDKYTKEREWLFSLDFITIVSAGQIDDEAVLNSMLGKKFEVNVLALVSLDNSALKCFNYITNALIDPKLIIATSNIAPLIPVSYKVIELVTGERPSRTLPAKLIFIDPDEVERVKVDDSVVTLVKKDKERPLYTGDKPLVMIKTNDNLNRGRTSINITRDYNTLLYEDVEDLCYLLTKKLSTIFSE